MDFLTRLDPGVLLLLGVLALIELGLVVAALWDLTRPGRRVRGDSRLMWALIILFVSTFGPIVYFLVGREEAGPTEDTERRAWPTAASEAGGSVAAAAGVPTSAPAVPPAPPVVSPAPRTALPTTTAPAAAAPAAVVARGLTKLYPGEILALDRLDLEVPGGSVFGLLGPNGAGKTTTLRILAGLAHATAGVATVAGIPVAGGGSELTRRIGYLDQDPRYYGWATGREIVGLVGRLHGLRGSELASRAGEVLGRVGLADAADRRLATYSGGMRQRLGIAQALVNRPAVLILDEPVSSLDPEGRRDLLTLIAELRGSATVLFSTHVLADVERICDRVAILDRGRLVTEGPLGALLDRYALPIYRIEPEPGQAAAVARLAATLRATAWTTDVTVEPDRLRVTVSDPVRAAAGLLPAVVAAGVTVASFERARPTLEDVFLQLVGRDANGATGAAGAAGATGPGAVE